MAKIKYFKYISSIFAIIVPMGGATYAQDAEKAPQASAQTPTADQSSDPITAEQADILPEPAVAPSYEARWSTENASKLLAVVKGIGKEGLKPEDYKPEALSKAIAASAGKELDKEADRVLAWMIQDIRDGRTPAKARLEWYVVDPDAKLFPTEDVIAKALETGDIAAALESIAPTHSDYAALRDALSKTTAKEITKRKRIMANMDRWRWLPRDLGKTYLKTNVPEYMLQFVVNKKQIATYRTVVGKPGRTATPQLADEIEGVVFNPTWTVPQSIVKGEGLGAKVLNNPSWAAARRYTATKGANGYVSVVQQPGPSNALGMMKLHMPNRHAIFLHDTPSRHLFKNKYRALSHGCIRTENALDLALVMANYLGDVPISRSKQIVKSLKYKLLPTKRTMPVYITYFTMATNVNNTMTAYKDIYNRDNAVFKSFDAKRQFRAVKAKPKKAIVPIKANAPTEENTADASEASTPVTT